MHPLEDFAEIVRVQEPLAPFTYLKLGGPAEMLVTPRSTAELAAVVKRCSEERVPFRVLGSGSNVLVREEGVKGAVIRLSASEFTQVMVEGKRVRAGTGALLASLISQAARTSLGGLETLVGIPGTVGGALRHNAGDRSGEIGQYVHKVEILDGHGRIHVRERDELRFAYRWSNLDDPVLLNADFELEPDAADAIVKRMRKAWIQRKATQPLSFEAACRVFKNPRGLSAAALIEQGGLAGTRVGGAEVSERHANFILADSTATARDVLRLIELVRSRVQERFHVEMELDISVW
jgi:UDP-N-acetylmuramate dehydrogenase